MAEGKLSAKHPHTEALDKLRAFGLRYPGAKTKSPWPEHLDLAVGDKTFAFLAASGQPFSISCKLTESRREALSLPFAMPTPYGLGKSGWVTAKLSVLEKPPIALFERWIDESYRARAPKKLIAKLDGVEEKGGAKKTSGSPKAKPARTLRAGARGSSGGSKGRSR